MDGILIVLSWMSRGSMCVCESVFSLVAIASISQLIHKKRVISMYGNSVAPLDKMNTHIHSLILFNETEFRHGVHTIASEC